MKELTLSTMIAVFEETFGRGLFWALVAMAALGTLAFLYVLISDRGLRSSRFLIAEIAGVFGGIAAILFVQAVTNSGFVDIGGPVDVIVVAMIWVAGFVGTVMVGYVAESLVWGYSKD